MILQQRIGTRAVGWHRQNGDEWICGCRNEKREENRHSQHRAKSVAHQVPVLIAIDKGEGADEHAQHRAPKENGALERRPQGNHRHPIGRGVAADLGDIGNREITSKQRAHHHQVGEDHGTRKDPCRTDGPGEGEATVTGTGNEARYGTKGGRSQTQEYQYSAELLVHGCSSVAGADCGGATVAGADCGGAIPTGGWAPGAIVCSGSSVR